MIMIMLLSVSLPNSTAEPAAMSKITPEPPWGLFPAGSYQSVNAG
jgi:hypothetical protein